MRKQKKGVCDSLLIRLYYLALADFPISWLEVDAQGKLNELSKVRDIDILYKVLFPRYYEILKMKKKSVAKYLQKRELIHKPFIKDRGLATQKAMTELLNGYLVPLIERYGEDKVVTELFDYLKIPENGQIPFRDIKQASLWRSISFKKNPEDVNKGTGLLIVLLLEYLIKKGEIYGDSVKYLENAINVYACTSSKALGIDVGKAWKLLNKALNAKLYNFAFSC